jgi:hypothetical protein
VAVAINDLAAWINDARPVCHVPLARSVAALTLEKGSSMMRGIIFGVLLALLAVEALGVAAELDPSVTPDPPRPPGDEALPGVGSMPAPYTGGPNFVMTPSLAKMGVNPMGQQDPNDYSQLSPTDAVYSPGFLADVKADIARRQGFAPDDPDKLRQMYFADRTFKNVNSVGIGKDMIDVHGMSPEDQARAARLQSVYEKFPDALGCRGRGLPGIVQNAAMRALDPVNLLLLGAVGMVARGIASRRKRLKTARDIVP